MSKNRQAVNQLTGSEVNEGFESCQSNIAEVALDRVTLKHRSLARQMTKPLQTSYCFQTTAMGNTVRM